MISFFAADGVAFRVPVRFASGAEYTTLTGATITAIAKSSRGVTVEGVASVTSATEAAVAFDPNALTPGTWTVQVRVIHPGEDGQTLVPPVSVTVRESYSA